MTDSSVTSSNTSPEEAKPFGPKSERHIRLHSVLEDKKFIWRSLDAISRATGEEPHEILEFLQANPEWYDMNVQKGQLLFALRSRVQKEQEKVEKEIRKAMEKEPKGTKKEAQRVPVPAKKADWDAILHNMSHVHITLNRTLRMIPPDAECHAQIVSAMGKIEDAYLKMAESKGITIK